MSIIVVWQDSEMQRDGETYLLYSKSSVSDGAKWTNNDAGAEDHLKHKTLKRQFHKKLFNSRYGKKL